MLATADPDIRSLRELLTYGLKGMAAYTYHALQLGHSNPQIDLFMRRALAATLDDSLTADDLVGLVMEAGKYGVEAMSLLDEANTGTYGHPEVTKVNIGVRNRPGILISGHDLKDLEELLRQTEGTGVDVYTHSEMLPAHYYPAFKKYDHFVGNYGNAWWLQTTEFAAFNGPILMTTNCIVPPKASYKDRMYTTGNTGFPGVRHIPEGPDGQPKDFLKSSRTPNAANLRPNWRAAKSSAVCPPHRDRHRRSSGGSRQNRRDQKIFRDGRLRRTDEIALLLHGLCPGTSPRYGHLDRRLRQI
ncbi:hypothetical protein HMSSN036_40810 [Paenibacillus macerans]|nr:hypothetical protein HMSSN036_40810 [Paenibacillus macerans]